MGMLHRRPIHSDQGTRPPLAHVVALLMMNDGLAPGGGRHHFPESRSFKAVLSHIASAWSRFSLAFHRKRHKIQSMFAQRKDWRRIATRYDRWADLFLFAWALAAIVMFWP
jgi:hypothetical protein